MKPLRDETIFETRYPVTGGTHFRDESPKRGERTIFATRTFLENETRTKRKEMEEKRKEKRNEKSHLKDARNDEKRNENPPFCAMHELKDDH